MNIEQLLEKYFEGETTIAEEKALKAFFNQGEVPEHLKVYQSQFQYFKKSATTDLNEKAFEKDFNKLIQLKSKSEQSNPSPFLLTHKNNSSKNVFRWTIGIAASVLIFASGIYLGTQIKQNGNSTQSEISALRKEMQETKQAVMLNLLKQASASDRIQAVNYAHEAKDGSPEILDALIETLNTDENSNVRLAAANALFTFKDVDKVHDALIQSLKTQEDPVVKIALVNMMIAMKDKKAVKSIQEFLDNEPLPKKAKLEIEKKLKDI